MKGNQLSHNTMQCFTFLLFCLSLVRPACCWVNVIQQGLPSVKKVTAKNIEISEIGCGTWSWGNRLLWDYDTSQDEEIYQSYKYVRNAGVTIFDTADSYGTLDLNGRAEILLGQFETRYLDERREQSENMNALSKMISNAAAPVRSQQVATKFAPYVSTLNSNAYFQCCS
jgi:hypothetical protein